ncbi:hypothetical protein B7494_g8228 [Chlorociboria aeruginascens]|nr:hypothetical protein B7494_g8228 [Chlorociboria aeruginascens]
MPRSSMTSSMWGGLIFCIFCIFFTNVAAGLTQTLCSTLNTGTTPANESIYQSEGLCITRCTDESYAFGIVQDQLCWCSDYAPATTVDLSNCNIPCPGYTELCGGTGFFGYLALSKAPLGTQGASSSSSSSSSTSSPSSTPVPVTTEAAPPTVTDTATATVTDTSLPSPSASSSSGSSSSSSSRSASSSSTTTPPTTTPTSSSSSTSSSSFSSSTWTPTPIISLETVTGQVRTVTVTPTIPPNQSQSLTGVAKKSSGGLGTGGAVGLTIGLVALVAIISGIIYFCFRKRRQEKTEDYNNVSRRGSSAGLGGPVPTRTMSENSRYVLGTDGRQVVETWEPDAPGSRRSRLMPVDPRLDPFAPVYQRGENKSRESVNTLRDDHDYSRRVHQQGPILRATNPDE